MARLIAATLAVVMLGWLAPASARAVEWQTVLELPSHNVARTPSVAFGPDGSLHIAFIRGVTASPPGPGFYYLTNATGSWTERKLANASINGDDSMSIAVDDDGGVHVVFQRVHDGIYYVTNRNGAWKTKVFKYTAFNNIYPRLAVDGNGKAHIAYFLTGPGGIRYTTNKSGKWKTKQVTTNAFDQRVDIAADSRGKVHIIHGRQNHGYRYLTNSTGTWRSKRLGGQVTTFMRQPSITMDLADRPVVAYGVLWPSEGHGLWTGTRTGSGWQLERQVRDAGATRVAVGADGSLHVGMDVASHVSNESGSWRSDGPGGNAIARNANGPAFALSRAHELLAVVFTGVDGHLIVHTRGAWDGWSSP